MKNYIQNGKIIHTVLAETVKGGDLVILNDVIGVAITDGDGTSLQAVEVEGVFSLPKGEDIVLKQGEKVYWGGKSVTNVADKNTLIGYAWENVGKTDKTVNVKLR